MRRTLLVLLSVGLLVILVASVRADEPTPPKGFTALFNGKDFTNWRGWTIHGKGGNPLEVAELTPEQREKAFAAWTEELKKHWKVENGEIVNPRNSGPYLATEKDYGDCELLIEYKISQKVDSGIYMKTMPQIQVWDPEDPDPGNKLGRAKGSGGMWNNPVGSAGRDPLVRADKPAGEWNKFRIMMVGERTTIYLNDQLVVNNSRLYNFWDKKAPLPLKAPILLQTHPPEKEIRWRNIFIREIAPGEANAILRKSDAEGFVDVFNGKDFTGWAGPIDQYEVKDGAIVCKPHKGGTIYTKDEYSDFVARVEYKLPPGGNNGLAIRYPGKGDTAYVGMCEVQVLDDTAKQYEKLDPRQYNGSVYGIVAAHRGYLRPVGEWNFEEVTVKGPHIKVEVNGNVIVDADVSKVTQYMANSPHPGKDNKSGHFGFAGHSDPVAFRNVQIKKLESK